MTEDRGDATSLAAAQTAADGLAATESSPGPAPGLRGRADLRRRRRRRTRRLQSVGLLVTVALMVSVRVFFFQAYFIPSPSMQPTLEVGDRVLVAKLSYRFGAPQRGQIVVFSGVEGFAPVTTDGGGWGNALLGLIGMSSDDDYIKRVIGIPGDRVRCCDEQGRLQVNGVTVEEPYLFPLDVPSRERFEIRVPPGRLWVMGDHRSRSADSRAHLGAPGGGTVPIDKVVGRAVAIVWPWRHAGWLRIPSSLERLATDGGTSGERSG